jgi:hypothetical protein
VPFSIAQNVDDRKNSSAPHRSPATGTSAAETGARRTLALPLCAMPIVDGGVASPRPAAGNAKRLATSCDVDCQAVKMWCGAQSTISCVKRSRPPGVAAARHARLGWSLVCARQRRQAFQYAVVVIFEQLEDRLEPWLAACPLFEQGSGNTGTFLEGQRDHGFGFDQSARKCVGAVRVDGASLRPRRVAISAMLSPSSSIRCLRLTDSFSPS